MMPEIFWYGRLKRDDGYYIYIYEGTNWVGENRYKECKFTWRELRWIMWIQGDIAWN